MNIVKRMSVLLAVLALVPLSWGQIATNESPLSLSIDLVDGSRLMGVPGIASIPVQTAYAKLDVALTNVLSIKMEENHKMALFEMRNGDKVKGAMILKTLNLQTAVGKVSLGLEQIAQVEVISGGSFKTGLEKGLVLYYSFDKDDGAKVTDESVRMNNGEVRGAQWVREGKRGGAYLFDGSGGHIRVPGSADFNFVDVTISAWVKPDDFATVDRNNVVSTLTTLIDDGGIQLDCSAYDVRFNYRAPGESTVVSERVFEPSENGRWHFIAATYHHESEESIVALYADGHLCKAVHQPTKQATYSNQQMFIGINCDGRAAGMGHDYGREFKGLIDEIRLYNRALSPEEMETLYNSEK
jgi:hypothetical protein